MLLTIITQYYIVTDLPEDFAIFANILNLDTEEISRDFATYISFIFCFYAFRGKVDKEGILLPK